MSHIVIFYFCEAAAILLYVVAMLGVNSSYAQLNMTNQTEDSNLAQPIKQSNLTQSANPQTAKDQYLAAWEQMGFRSAFDTFVKEGSIKGYGVYQKLDTNLFDPEDSIVLYVEPVGFSYKEGIDRTGNPVYQVSLNASATIFDKQGKELSKIDFNPKTLNSYQKVTEIYLELGGKPPTPLPEGDYKATITVMDQISGRSFQVDKDIKIAEIARS